MFLEVPSGNLRQGDICGIKAFPLWDISATAEVTFPNGVDHLQLPAWHQVLEDDGLRLVVVCSHDCDLENPRSRTGLLIAPLVKVPANPNEDRFERIMASAVTTDDVFEYINLFPLTINHVHAAAEFSAITHIAQIRTAIEMLAGNKRAEMTEDTRAAFKKKLAAFLGRP